MANSDRHDYGTTKGFIPLFGVIMTLIVVGLLYFNITDYRFWMAIVMSGLSSFFMVVFFLAAIKPNNDHS